jgi:hypothetical protein
VIFSPRPARVDGLTTETNLLSRVFSSQEPKATRAPQIFFRK